jgi:hypothetical protein
MSAPVYGASPTRARRARSEIEHIRRELVRVAEENRPATVRQIYYRLVSEGVIAKTEQEYKGTVCRLLSDLRREGELPYGWIADNTRWMRKPATFDSLEEALELTRRTYRRALWTEQDVYVEVWLEKDALAGVLFDVTSAWDVPLMVTRGYPSLTFLHSAAEAIDAQGKPTFLYYLGDHDPSGVDIPKRVEAELRRMAPDAEIYFERLAVNVDQIGAMGLPTRPTKKTDSRSKTFEGESVEVDAIPPATLREMVDDAIVQHVDGETYERTLAVERAERESLQSLIRRAS